MEVKSVGVVEMIMALPQAMLMGRNNQVNVFLHNIAHGAKGNEAMKEKRRRRVLTNVSSNSLPVGFKLFRSPLYVKRNQIKGTSLLHG